MDDEKENEAKKEDSMKVKEASYEWEQLSENIPTWINQLKGVTKPGCTSRFGIIGKTTRC